MQLPLTGLLLVVCAANAIALFGPQGEKVKLGRCGRTAFLEAHNIARRQVGVPPLKWSYELDNIASAWAMRCEYAHSKNEYGENIAYSTVYNENRIEIATNIVKSWTREKAISDRNGDFSCIYDRGAGRTCGHYSQIVWRDTTHIGCAIVHCPNLPNYVVCNYDPPGNFRNQDPF